MGEACRFQGRPIVLFSIRRRYAGCTKQACKLRDGYREFQKRKVAVFGVSAIRGATRSFEPNTNFRTTVSRRGWRDRVEIRIDQMPIVGFQASTVLIGADE